MSTVAPSRPVVRQTGLLTWLFLLNAAILTVYAGFIVILVPDQIARIDEQNKVANLAIVMTASSIATIIIHPLIGALSDRTRSRLGRRAPWMLLGGATGALFTVLLAGAGTIWAVCLYWILMMLCVNSVATVGSAIVPDRFAKERLGVASAVVALGIFVGMGAGVALAGLAVNSIGIGYAAFGIGFLIVCVLFVVFNRDFSSREMHREPFSWRAFFASFWVSPRRYPDFWWAFAGRFFLILAYQSVQSYLLYILRDYIGLSDAESTGVSTLITAVMLIGALVTTYFCGRISDRTGRRKVFVFVSSLIMAVSLLIPLLLPSLTGMFALAAVFGVGYGIYMSVDTALMNEVLPAADQAAKDLGILNIATALPQAFTPALVGVLILLSGGYSAVFIAGIVFAVLGALTVIPIRSVR
ncbi:MFS family permease [Microbacterium sp. W4I4]|uniref:MFS transporter n=1 Tax=Microbacterium sp. W4I4 TaxID=3042295 RepID=UPI00278B5B21|nr:MFS transporter [Microbacterium sp. W4I4]MDQ0613413.1 MFS family permease [Microbacterium sp. W4I4]